MSEGVFTFLGYFTIGDLLGFIAFVHLLALIVGVLYVLQRILQDIINFGMLKTCPSCRERVKRSATKCKHCHERLA